MDDVVVVTKAEYIDGYMLKITFSDGLWADIDFSKWIKNYPFFEPLKDVDYFKSFTLDGWTVAWPNGADIAPETLHALAVKAQYPQAA
jgi:hypothetical protein